MKVILTEKVPALGNVGEIVKVSAGHARNYLVPRKLAVIADEGQKKMVDNHLKRLEKKIAEEKKTSTDLKGKLDKLSIEMIKKVGGNGKLFGSITSMELVKELEKQGLSVEKRMIHIENPIKQLGQYEIKVKLMTGIEAKFKVKVTMDEKQAQEFKEKEMKALKEKKNKAAKKAEEGEKVEAADAAADTEEKADQE